ncbi:MAG: hypothetical protein PVH61_10545 [Candidatus Aminicenantes bacterium]|jgi:hypothetical protein
MTYFYWLNKLFQIFKKCIVDFPYTKDGKCQSNGNEKDQDINGGKFRQENFVKFLLKYEILTPPLPFIIKLIGWNLRDERWEPGPFFLRYKKNGSNVGASSFALGLLKELLASEALKIDPFRFMFNEIPRKPSWCIEVGEKKDGPVKVRLDEAGEEVGKKKMAL